MLYFIAILSGLNFIILIALAGSMAKLIRYIRNEPDDLTKEGWSQIIRDRRVLDTQTRTPNYTDVRHMDVPPNWNGLPRGKNWDGLPNTEE